MSRALTRNAMRLNRWIAGVGGVLFISNCLRALDYWGAAFGTLVFVWVACRFPFSDRPWATAGRRTAGVAFVATALAAIWFTIRR
jgi:hypothetical protein